MKLSGFKTYIVAFLVVLVGAWDWYSGSNAMSDKALLLGGLLAATIRSALKSTAAGMSDHVKTVISDIYNNYLDVKSLETLKNAILLDSGKVQRSALDAAKTWKDIEALINAAKEADKNEN